jgi:putative transposase
MTTYKRKRFTFNKFEKLFIILFSRIFPSWKNSLIIVKPKTVIQWKHTFFRWFWKWKCGILGRPSILKEIRLLIQKMRADNPSWGAFCFFNTYARKFLFSMKIPDHPEYN